jgi:ElaB/YqjD/DUF883 family membrane-anchored ribosome-binding protein
MLEETSDISWELAWETLMDIPEQETKFPIDTGSLSESTEHADFDLVLDICIHMRHCTTVPEKIQTIRTWKKSFFYIIRLSLTLTPMRLITLLAGYAAGLAVAMKYRGNTGSPDTTDKTKVDAFIDDVVDIHKSAYTWVKKFVATNFDDVHDMESLKTKAGSLLDSAKTEAEALIASLQEKGIEKKEAIESEVDALFAEKEKVINAAQARSADLADTATDTVTSWIDIAKSRLQSVRDSIRENIRFEASIEDLPAEKSVTMKAPAKKPAAKKTPKA